MPPRPLLLALLAGALIPSPATAQVTSAAEPNSPASASRIKLGVDGAASAFGGRVPTGIALLLDRGFQVDLATPAVCGYSAGQGGGCPARSQVAAGSALVETSTLGGPATEVRAVIDVFRAERPGTGQPADILAPLLAVIRTEDRKSYSEGYVRRTDQAPFGYEVRFDQLSTPGAPLGTTVRLKRFDLDLGAAWTEPVTVTRKVRCKQSSRSRSCKKRAGCKAGKRCARYRTVRETRLEQHNLLRNPERCTGTWGARTVATFADGSTATLDAPIACAVGT